MYSTYKANCLKVFLLYQLTTVYSSQICDTGMQNLLHGVVFLKFVNFGEENPTSMVVKVINFKNDTNSISNSRIYQNFMCNPNL